MMEVIIYLSELGNPLLHNIPGKNLNRVMFSGSEVFGP